MTEDIHSIPWIVGFDPEHGLYGGTTFNEALEKALTNAPEAGFGDETWPVTVYETATVCLGPNEDRCDEDEDDCYCGGDHGCVGWLVIDSDREVTMEIMFKAGKPVEARVASSDLDPGELFL